MNSRDIRYFIETYREKSISKAAEKLFITPQGLSKNIKKIEDEVGVQLFLRTPRGVELTTYGEKFYKRAALLYEELENMRTMFEGEIDSLHGKLRISSAIGILTYLYPEYLLDFSKKYPNVDIMIKERTDYLVDEDVKNETVTIGLSKEPVNHKEFDVYPIQTYRHCALIYRGHPLYDRDEISVEDLKDERIIIESSEFKVYKDFIDLCGQKGFHPSIYFETTEISMAHKLAHLEKGIAISLEAEFVSLPYDNLKMVFFKEDLLRKWVIITKKNREMDSVTHAMLKYLGVSL